MDANNTKLKAPFGVNNLSQTLPIISKTCIDSYMYHHMPQVSCISLLCSFTAVVVLNFDLLCISTTRVVACLIEWVSLVVHNLTVESHQALRGQVISTLEK